MSEPIQLNRAQQEAIDHVGGPLLVIAGAGTGKTSVMAERVASLVRNGHATPGEVLAVTFTIEAAANLKRKIHERLRETAGVPWVPGNGLGSPPDNLFSNPDEGPAEGVAACTFHAYCANLLERNGAGFTLLEKEDLWVYLRRRIDQLPLERYLKAANPAKFLNDFLEFFSRCDDELVDSRKYSEYIECLRLQRSGLVGAKDCLPLPQVAPVKGEEEVSAEETLACCEEIARVYRCVEKLLAEENLGTYGTQIVRAVNLLKQNPGLLAEEQKRTRFILIDEFQDCNSAQIELAVLLSGQSQNVFAVGDPDQAVYRFRGASSTAFDHFRLRFPGMKQVTLAENQRSTPAILECAYSAIQKNPFILEGAANAGGSYLRQRLESARHAQFLARNQSLESLPVEVVVADSIHQEAAHIVDSILDLRGRFDSPWKEFAVLYRTHAHREQIMAHLNHRKIPFDVAGVDLLETDILRDLVAVLRSLDSFSDHISLFRVAIMPQFEMDYGELKRQLHLAERDTPLSAVLDSMASGARVIEKLRALRDTLRLAEVPVSEVVNAAIDHFGFDERRREVSVFRQFVAKWESKSTTKSRLLPEFLEYLTFFHEARGSLCAEAPQELNVVRLMTAHAAKGLEFKHVFIMRVSSQSFPVKYTPPLFEFPAALRQLGNASADEDSKEMHTQEERRLFYVAMTRARDTLMLTAKAARGKERVPLTYLRELVKDFGSKKDKTLAAYLRFADARPLTGEIVEARRQKWLEIPVTTKDSSLSATSIEMYARCPLQYKLVRDWRITSEPTAALQFGYAMHNVLRDYYEAVRAGRPHSPEKTIEIFKSVLSDDQIVDPYQRELYEKHGEVQLREFITSRQAENAPAVLDTERKFTMSLGNATVTGRFDRVDETPGGGVKIIDYKTGNPKTQEDADNSLQFSIYALAAKNLWKRLPESLVYYNLQNNTVIESTRSAHVLDKAEERVATVADGISKKCFDPKTGMHCKWCAFRSLCPATEQRLYSVH